MIFEHMHCDWLVNQPMELIKTEDAGDETLKLLDHLKSLPDWKYVCSYRVWKVKHFQAEEINLTSEIIEITTLEDNYFI